MPPQFPKTEIQLDESDLKRLPRKSAASAENAVKRAALFVEGAASVNAPVAKFRGKKKGTNLANSGVTVFSGRGFNIVAEIKFTASYALWVHRGTGIFGPHRSRIVPRSGGVMTWIDTDTGERIFARSTKGMPGRPFLKEALEEEGLPRLQDFIFS